MLSRRRAYLIRHGLAPRKSAKQRLTDEDVACASNGPRPRGKMAVLAEIRKHLLSDDSITAQTRGFRVNPITREPLTMDHPVVKYHFETGYIPGQPRIGSVSVDKLHSPQTYVDPKRVYAVNKHKDKLASVIIHEGRPILVDGNHRATRAWLVGDEHIPAAFWEYKGGKFIPYRGDLKQFR